MYGDEKYASIIISANPKDFNTGKFGQQIFKRNASIVLPDRGSFSGREVTRATMEYHQTVAENKAAWNKYQKQVQQAQHAQEQENLRLATDAPKRPASPTGNGLSGLTNIAQSGIKNLRRLADSPTVRAAAQIPGVSQYANAVSIVGDADKVLKQPLRPIDPRVHKAMLTESKLDYEKLFKLTAGEKFFIGGVGCSVVNWKTRAEIPTCLNDLTTITGGIDATTATAKSNTATLSDFGAMLSLGGALFSRLPKPPNDASFGSVVGTTIGGMGAAISLTNVAVVAQDQNKTGLDVAEALLAAFRDASLATGNSPLSYPGKAIVVTQTVVNPAIDWSVNKLTGEGSLGGGYWSYVNEGNWGGDFADTYAGQMLAYRLGIRTTPADWPSDLPRLPE